MRTTVISIFLIAILCISCEKEEASDTIENLNNYSYTGDVFLKNQQEIDSFGQIGYRKIIGSVTVGSDNSNESIDNLEGLSSLFYITEDLRIEGIHMLKNLDRLNGLIEVNRIYIVGNNGLTNIDGLNNINTTISFLYIESNTDLQRINGFENVPRIRNLDIRYNNHLTQIEGFSKVRSISNFYIEGNDAIEYIDGFNSLRTISEIWVNGHDKLKNIDFLRGVSYQFIELLYVQNNKSLMNLDGIRNVQHVKAGVIIYNNDSLTNIDGLKNVKHIETTLHIGGNDLLTNLDGLVRLAFIKQWISIEDNESLSDLCGLQPIVASGNFGFLNIESNLVNPSIDQILDGECNQ